MVMRTSEESSRIDWQFGEPVQRGWMNGSEVVKPVKKAKESH